MINANKVSIVVPIYNAEKYLKKCLDSLINQTYRNIEIVLVIDASPDNSLQIAEEYALKDNRLVVNSLAQNVGVSKARNIGIKMATGNYIYFVDPDDFVDTNMVELIVNEMEETYDLIITGLYKVYEDGRDKHNILPNKPFIAHQLKEFGTVYHELDEAGILYGPYNKLYKKSILINNAIEFPPFSLGEDQCFVLRYLICCNTIKVCKFSSYYYVNHISASNSKGVQRSFDSVYAFLTLKFSLKNQLSALLGLPLETQETFYSKNLLEYLSIITALFSPKFPLPSYKRKNELKNFRNSKVLEIYKKRDLGTRLNLIKIPICYFPIPLADFVLKKFIGYYYSK